MKSLLRRFRRSEFAPRYLKRLERKQRILAGPFAGMAYHGEAVGSAATPKMLGTYELELVPLLNQWAAIPFTTIIDAGAAEGYYAIGCARMWPQAKVTAFEAQTEGRRMLERNAQLNGVSDRVTISGLCNVENLRAALNVPPPTLLIMDVEGAERELLDPAAVPEVANVYFIAEVHDCFIPNLGEVLSARLGASHELTEIWTRERIPEDFRYPRNSLLRRWMWLYLLQYADELRPGPMRWICGVPRARH